MKIAKTYLENADITLRGREVIVLTRPNCQPVYTIHTARTHKEAQSLYRELVIEHTNEDGE